MIQLSSIVFASSDLLSTELDGELVMMDLVSGQYISLDRIGTEIWRGLAQPRKVAELCQALGERYEAPAEEIERDVLALLVRMEENKLIRVQS
jgi:hypothetical protein